MIKYIILSLLFGGIAGYINSSWGTQTISTFVSDYVFNIALIALLFFMGISFGLDKESTKKLRQANFRILSIPFAVASGSIIGGLTSGLILGINPIASMSVCAGYGWYTLAGPLNGQLFGAEWGALGFTVNFLRELLTIATISLTVKIDKYAPVAMGGATTMDTTLPAIVHYCGQETLITAFSSGFILTLIAPFTITTIATLAY
ncbi:MAG: lysine exporter LysO family protein [Candidatus Bathyarchaeia archaeon]